MKFSELYRLLEKNGWVKKKGTNIVLYRRLIEYETGKTVQVRHGEVAFGDSIVGRYTFRMNYYFMAGDLVSDSRDSRYWGLLPEEHIVGKVAFIWSLKDAHTKKYRWDRFFKKTN